MLALKSKSPAAGGTAGGAEAVGFGGTTLSHIATGGLSASAIVARFPILTVHIGPEALAMLALTALHMGGAL